MSVFNGSKHLNEAIECILNQDFKDFEFIIVNDASIDNSLKIIKDYAKKDDRIKIITNKKNIGLTKSLNKAIRLSKGEFIARHDVDDISLKNRLKKQVDCLEANIKYAFCGANGFQVKEKKDLAEVFEMNEILTTLAAENCFSHPTILIRKEILEEYGYYDETFRYGQDYELWCRLLFKYKLNAKILRDKLVIRNMPETSFLKKDKRKFITQRINSIRTKTRYIKYTRYKFKSFISIIIRLLEIMLLSHLMGLFSNLLKKIKF